MELNVPFVRQPPESVWCSAAAIAMVLKYFGRTTSLRRVVRELNIRSAKGVSNAHLASYFLTQGLNATVQAWPAGMPESLRSKQLLSGEAAVKVLTDGRNRLKGKARVTCRELTAFAKRGGNVVFSPFTLEDLRTRIDQGIPVVLNVDIKQFTDISRKTGHYVVAYGVTDRDSQVSRPYAYVHDPLRGPEKFIPVERLLDACNSWFGSVIYAEKRLW